MSTIYNRLTRSEPDDISSAFFDRNNMAHLHSQIIRQVHLETGIRISKQSDMEVLHIMQNIFNIHGATSQNHPRKNGQIIMDLNYKVIRECTDNIKSGILMYTKYIHDASRLPVPLERPKLTTTDHSLPFAPPNAFH